MWRTDKFKNLEQVKGIINLIKREEFLDAFYFMNLERLISLFWPRAKVQRFIEGNFCSLCDYEFKINEETNEDESDYHYCVHCREELACCDDITCDKDRERAEESARSFLYYTYMENNKIY
jgi:hypothetical protein